jgi:hypothetical protein
MKNQYAVSLIAIPQGLNQILQNLLRLLAMQQLTHTAKDRLTDS